MRELRTADGLVLGSIFKLLQGISLIAFGRFREPRQNLEEALDFSRRCGDIESSFALPWLAECCLELGDTEGALRFAREGVEKAQKYHNTYAGIWADRFLGAALLACRRVSEACAVLDRALASTRVQGTALHGEADFLQLLAAALLAAGQRESARERCAEAIAIAQRNGTPLFECDAHLVWRASP